MLNAALLPVEKICTLSTIHLTLEDSHFLDMHAGLNNIGFDLPRIENHEYGWFIFLASSEDRRYAKALKAKGASKALVGIFKLAASQGFSFINFDRDGEEVDGLNRFDW